MAMAGVMGVRAARDTGEMGRMYFLFMAFGRCGTGNCGLIRLCRSPKSLKKDVETYTDPTALRPAVTARRARVEKYMVVRYKSWNPPSYN